MNLAITETENPISNYIDDQKPFDEIDGFAGNDAMFEDEGEVLIDQMDQLIDELEGEINGESYEVMSQKMKYQKNRKCSNNE